MDEQRKFNRLFPGEEKATLVVEGKKEEVNILDVSAGGMKVCLSRQINPGSLVYGEFRILPELGKFFVRGKITRIVSDRGFYQVSVQFDKISAIPISV